MCSNTGIGKIYIVGAGPGDPGLVTLRAVEILNSVSTIYVPRADFKKESLVLGIIKSVVKDNTVISEINYPVGGGNVFWEKEAARISVGVKNGEKAAFVTLGDPSIYSVSDYFYRYIRERIPENRIEFIPGITSVSAGAAILKTSLVSGRERLAIIPLPDNPEIIDGYIDLFDKVVIMKIGRDIDKLIEYLKSRKLEDSTGFVSRAGLQNEYFENNIGNIDSSLGGNLSVAIIDTRR